MSAARTAFFERIESFAVTVNHEALIARAPAEIEHNNSSRMLRNGMAIVGFSVLEDFLRSRCAEILGRVGGGSLPFNELPAALRDASIYGALRAITFHADLKMRLGEDHLSFIQSQANMIASTNSAAYQLSDISLGWDRPNINHEDVKNCLRAFQINDPWRNIGRLAARVGLASPSHEEAFKQAALRRHLAAHRADIDTETSQLESFIMDAKAIAIAFDALVSKALRRLLDMDNDYVMQGNHVTEEDVSIRFLDPDGGRGWRDIKENGRKATRRSIDLPSLKARCLASPYARHELVVQRNESHQPVEWFIPEIA